MSDDPSALATSYLQYRNALASIHLDRKFIPYDWGNLPSPLIILWMAYGQMFDEFSREIANSINQLMNDAHRLKAWAMVMGTLDTSRGHEVLFEFVESLATLAINLPYVIRSRFIFAAAHLAHQANQLRDAANWRDDLPLDVGINFSTADNYGGRWNSYNKLKLCLEKISAKDYQDATGNFRHKYNHRFSPRIVYGITGMVTRHVDRKTGHVSYSFGETPPLPLDLIVKLLDGQCDRCYEAFEAFKSFVREHESHIREHSALS